MIEAIGAFIGNLITSAFGDGLCHGIGFCYVWLKNRGRKSYGQIRQETESLSDTGKTVIAQAFAGTMILLLLGLLGAGLCFIINGRRGGNF